MLKLFDAIAQHNSPTDKVRLLREYPYQADLKEVLRYALDPFITFGITSMVRPTHWAPQNEDQAHQLLDLMSLRKLTGNEARVKLGECMRDAEDFEVYLRIIQKDLCCGLGPKLVLQAYPGLIRQFDVMRAAKFTTLPTRGNFVIEPKYDGLRCIAMVDEGAVTLLSRNGKEFTSSDHLKDSILKLGRNGVFDGELTSGNFNSSVSAVKRKSEQNDSTVYNIFDYLDPDEWKTPVNSWRQRRFKLTEMFRAGTPSGLVLTPAYDLSSEADAFKYYNQFLNLGYEGGIVKNARGIYRFSRHRDWMKLKETNDADLRVESLVEGEGKYRGMLGAAIVFYNNKRVSVGSGFSDEQRELFWQNSNLILKKVIEIHYHQVTPEGSLRHPRFIKIREDKS